MISAMRRPRALDWVPLPTAGASAISPGRFVADVACAFQLALIEIDHIAAQVGVVFQDRPRQGMILVSHAKEAAERHDRIGDFSGRFVDHHIVNRAEIPCWTDKIPSTARALRDQ